MGRRGQRTFEERIGEDKFKELLKRLQPQDIAKLYCDHYVEEIDRAKCKACLRTIYRAKKRMEEKESSEKRFDPIEQFEAIPELQSFIGYMESKKVKYHDFILQLNQMWTWIRESNIPSLVQTQRPALWDTPHIEYILKKIHEREVATYKWKQALRRFFESQGRLELLKKPLLTARVQDMRSPKGAKRLVMQFSPSKVPEILACVNGDMQRLIKTHITVKSREQSLLDTEWDAINWEDSFYGFPTPTITIYETKTKGGTYWEHCPLDLWFGSLSKELREEWERQGQPANGRIFKVTYEEYRKAWVEISEKLGKKFEAHDCRRSVGGWLRDLGLSDLALGQYNPLSGKAYGYTGVGWENPNIYYQRYGKRNPLAIYDKEKRLDIAIFDGLIHKIMENK